MRNKFGGYLGLLVFVLPALFSCAQQKRDWMGTIDVVDGVPVVKNQIAPLYPDLRIKFEEDLTIGVMEGDENYMFGSNVFLNTDDEGNFYVTDWDKKIVKKYDQEGMYLKSLGGPGQGPGEFQDISEVRFDIKGNIYLNDVKSNRISFLDKDGQYISGIRTPVILERVVINSRGFCIARSVDNVELGQGKKWDYFYGLFDDKFNLIKEFLRLPQEARALSKNSGSLTQVYADYLSSIAFKPYVNYTIDKKNMIYFGYPEDYEIKVYSSDGKLTKIIQRDFKREEISNEDKNYFARNQIEQSRGKIPAGEEKKVFQFVNYPKYKPAYERFTLMENGWIFVIVDSLRGGTQLVDIFNQDGEYLTQFEIDIPTEWLSFNNGKAYTVAEIDDYKFIKRYNYEILGN